MPGAEKIVGREQVIEQLDRCWNEGVRIVSIVAFGGVGKSALVHEWLQRMAAVHWCGAERVYGWSFYRQGMGGGASSDDFFDDALKWFGEANPPTIPWDKGRRLAELVQKERTLLVLDGIEPLQQKPQGPDAKIQDTALASFIRSMATATSGLCVLTTRIRVADVKAKRASIVSTLELDHLSEEAGAELLRARGADGSKSELHAASRDYKGHALALTLLGTYVREACEGQIARRHGLPSFEGEPAQRMMALYEQWFAGEPELSILRVLGLFDRPAPKDEVDELRREPPIPGLTEDLVGTRMFDPAWNTAVTRLRDGRLMAPKNADGTIDVHPLVREYFGKRLRSEHSEAFREGHRRLYEFLQNKAKPFPETITEMQPLYAAVRHGCLGRRHDEALEAVYAKRIKRGGEHFSTRKLGLFNAEVAALWDFFANPWEEPSATLSPLARAYLFNQSGFALRAVGRLTEAIQCFVRALDAYATQSEWSAAVTVACNVSEMLQALGDLSGSCSYARNSIEFANKNGDAFMRSATRARLAAVLTAQGHLARARGLFIEAEQISNTTKPSGELLYSVSGWQYCEFLLDSGAFNEALMRAIHTLGLYAKDYPILSLALDNLTFGKATFMSVVQNTDGELVPAHSRIENAVAELRLANAKEFLPFGLLARAALHTHTRAFADARADLDEAMDIASHCGFRLHEADACLGYARLGVAEGDTTTAREHLAKAQEIIDETGYHRRDGEVREIESQLGAP